MAFAVAVETGRGSFFDRERTIAEPQFSRWLVPPAALAIHLAIGQAYAFSVFKLPMTTLIGVTAPAPGDVRDVLPARPILYATIPHTERVRSVPLFVICCVLIITMYGGGFATVPAYLRDLFGTMQVGAIHGRLLTAWSVAGILGPLLVNDIRQSQIDHGVAKANAYAVTMYLMAGLLLIGLVCDLLVRPVDERHHYKGPAGDAASVPPVPAAVDAARTAARQGPDPLLAARLGIAWLIVGVPLAWGLWQVVVKSFALF